MNEKIMKRVLALVESTIGENIGGPFGSIIAKGDKVISSQVNQVTSLNDPTAHAEILAIREASQKLGTYDLSGCDLYATCEPCPMCLGAILWARIDRVFFAVDRLDAAKIGFDDAHFYQEVCKPLEERTIPMIQFKREDGLRLLNMWYEKEDKMLY